MRDRLTHRGPDDCGQLIEDLGDTVMAMGHRRLSILDLSTTGRQPMNDKSGRFVISFNGEIYNYIEIREELLLKGYSFESDTDTEVLLNAFAEWGQDCLYKLNGMFAFAIWDRKEKILFVARDRFGEKPLYYTSLPQLGIAFASEAKALFAHPDIEAKVNKNVANDFINGITSYSNEETFFENVYRLQPAHAMLVNDKGEIVKKWRYWLPDYDTDLHKGKHADLEKEFYDRLKKSVQLRLRSDVKVGTCLSGGLDSSVLTGMVKQLHDEGKASLGNSYSARFDDDPTISEGAYIDSMVNYKKLNPEFIHPHAANIIKESQALHWHQEQPFLSASMYLEWCVVRRAKETGTTVLLDGQGADEVLAGYQYYFPFHQRDQLYSANLFSLAKNTYLFNSRIKREAHRYENSERRINSSVALDTLGLSKAALKELYLRIKVRKTPEDDQSAGLPKNQRYNGLRTLLARGLLYDMLPNNLHSADCNGMAHSIETRFPYIDYDLVDWCLKLPNDLLIKHGWQKYILRQAARGIVPDDIRWRVDKVGFAAPQDNWLRGDLKEWAYEKLFNGPIVDLEAYDRSVIESFWSKHQSGEEDVSWALWRWISLNEWLMLFKDNVWKSA